MKYRAMKSVLAAVCTGALLCACGASGMSADSTSAAYETGNYDGGATYDTYATEAAYDTADYAPPEEAEVVGSGTNDITAQSKEAGTDESGKISEQKLIYTADVQIQTMVFSDTIAAVKDAISKVNGFVESESTSDSAWNWYYSNYKKSNGTLSSHFTIRVPSDKYREFLTLLDGTGGKITSKSEYVQNITKSYNDQSILIQSLETQETRLLDMMDKADTIEDMIAIESRLSEVQTQLNQARNILASFDTDVAYSTVNLHITEVLEYSHTQVERTFVERLTSTFTRSWSDFADFLQDLVLAIVYLLPVILVVIIILVIFRPFLKKWNEKRKAKKAAKKAMKAAKAAGYENDNARRFPNPFAKKPKENTAEAVRVEELNSEAAPVTEDISDAAGEVDLPDTDAEE